MFKERIKNLSLSQQRRKEEFSNILRNNEMSKTNGIIYIVLAFLFGYLGVHNLYAKFWKRGLAQLLLTLISPFLGIGLLFFASNWALVELFAQNRDKSGRLFRGNRTIIRILRVFALLMLAYAVWLNISYIINTPPAT